MAQHERQLERDNRIAARNISMADTAKRELDADFI
jgi:hypothetical protein